MENFKIPGKTPEEREIEVNAAIENLDPKSKELFDGVFEDTENLG